MWIINVLSTHLTPASIFGSNVRFAIASERASGLELDLVPNRASC